MASIPLLKIAQKKKLDSDERLENPLLFSDGLNLAKHLGHKRKITMQFGHWKKTFGATDATQLVGVLA